MLNFISTKLIYIIMKHLKYLLNEDIIVDMSDGK